MSSVTLGEIRRGWLAASAGCALLLVAGVAAGPAWAGDDGAAPLWVGLGSIFGFGGTDQEPIEYRDHGRLVLPPKMELPAPAASTTVGSVAWPQDQEVLKRKKEQEEKAKYIFVPVRRREPPSTTNHSVVTQRATAGTDPDAKACDNGPGSDCGSHSVSAAINWNPLTWVGLQKKAPTVLGPEPSRDYLTDPPSGFREPVEGPGVRIDN